MAKKGASCPNSRCVSKQKLSGKFIKKTSRSFPIIKQTKTSMIRLLGANPLLLKGDLFTTKKATATNRSLGIEVPKKFNFARAKETVQFFYAGALRSDKKSLSDAVKTIQKHGVKKVKEVDQNQKIEENDAIKNKNKTKYKAKLSTKENENSIKTQKLNNKKAMIRQQEFDLTFLGTESRSSKKDFISPIINKKGKIIKKFNHVFISTPNS